MFDVGYRSTVHKAFGCAALAAERPGETARVAAAASSRTTRTVGAAAGGPATVPAHKRASRLSSTRAMRTKQREPSFIIHHRSSRSSSRVDTIC
jgi:hypothetical protein